MPNLPALTISVLATEYVRVPVKATKSGVAVNLVPLVVQMAFKARGTDPAGADWKTGSWESAPSPVVDAAVTKFWALCLVGPGAGGTALAKGSYIVWLKVTDNPEIPVRQVATLRVI